MFRNSVSALLAVLRRRGQRPIQDTTLLRNDACRADLRFQSGASFDGNRLTGLELSKRKVKIGLTTVYLDGRETLSASRMRFCCSSGMGSFVTAILSSTCTGAG